MFSNVFFVYKTVPHITLKSIANNEPPATETLYDQPEIDKTKIRVTAVIRSVFICVCNSVTPGQFVSAIAMWMLDTDYDGMCIVPKQVFFPMGGKKDGWNKLAMSLY